MAGLYTGATGLWGGFAGLLFGSSALSTPPGLLADAASSFNPASLFANGEPGVWYDPSDFSTMFQDAAGTTPVTAVEQPVGLLLDRSKGLALGSDLVTNGDFSSGAGWTLQAGQSISGGELAFIASSGVAGRTDTFTNNATYKVTIVIASYTAGDVQISINGGSFMEFDITATGTYTRYIRAGNTTTNLNIAAAGGASTWGMTSVSVYELPGNHAFQSTIGLRPVLSARVNALVQTEDFSNASWFKSGVTGTVSVLTATAGAGRHQTRQAIFSGANAKASIQFSPGTHLYAHLSFYDGGVIYATAIYQLQGSGTVSQTANSSGTIASSTITPNSDGSFTCTLTTTFTSAPTLNLSVGFAQQATGNTIDSSGIPTFTAAGTETLSVTNADARVTNVGSNMPAYQRVGAATYGTSTVAGNPDYDTSGFPFFLGFNGVTGSRWMVSSTITPGTDKAQVFAGVRKLSDAGIGVFAELSTIVTNAGTFSIYAPNTSGTYASLLNGSALGANNYATFTAPITNVLTNLYDIAQPTIATEISFRANGVVVSGSSFGAADAGTGNFGNYPLYIGARAGSSLYYNGNLYELIVRFGPNLSESTIDQTEVWVGDKTGLDLNYATQQTIFDRFNATVLNRAGTTILQRY
jgi:hypothetical protein